METVWKPRPGRREPSRVLRRFCFAARSAHLVAISSPYARRGLLWQRYAQHYGQDGDPVLVWQGDTRSMNPTIDPAVIASAYETDSSHAAAEFGAEFR